jgi:hypothetical protein
MENETKMLKQEIDSKESDLMSQNIAGIIDGALMITLFLILTNNLPQIDLDKLQSLFRLEFYIFIMFGLYRLVALLLINSTVGMWLSSIKLQKIDGEKLNIKEKICAAFFVLINGVGYYNR